MFEDLKDSKNDLPKIPRFHHPPSIIQKVSRSFQNYFDLIGFTYVLRLSTIIQDLLRFHHRIFRFYLKRSEMQIVLDPKE